MQLFILQKWNWIFWISFINLKIFLKEELIQVNGSSISVFFIQSIVHLSINSFVRTFIKKFLKSVNQTWFTCNNIWLISWSVYYVPWSAPNFDTDSHQSYHGWGLVKKYPMQNFRPLEQQEPLLGWPWSFHRNLWQRQNLHNRNIDSNANSIQTSTSP